MNATLATIGNVVSLAAFPVAGILAYRFGVKAMLLDAVLLLIGAFTLIPYLNIEVRRDRITGNVEEKPLKVDRKLVIGILTSVLLFNFALGSLRIFIFASLRALGKGEVLYGVLQSLTTAGSFVAVVGLAHLAGRKRTGVERPLIVGMLLQSLALLLVGFPLVQTLVSAVLIVGFGGELLNVSFDSLMQKVIPLGSLGTARGIFDAFATLVIPLSQLVFAWGIEKIGETLPLAISAFFLALSSSSLYWEVLKKAKA